MENISKIYVDGHRVLVRSTNLKNPQNRGCTNFDAKTHEELGLTNQTT